MEIAKNGLREC